MLPDAKAHAGCFLLLGPLVALLTVSLIRSAERSSTISSGWITPIRDLGTISYAAYLWNFPIVNWLHGPGLPIVSAWRGALSIPLTILAAYLSWHLAEKHIARIKRELDSAPARQIPLRPRRLVMPAFDALAKAA
jgi:peptidoglycan/LPS O-acetylase OafA/YrhL